MNGRYKISRRFLIFWTMFIGVGAVCGASVMLLDTSGKALGMDGMLPFFQVLPFANVLFQDFLFSGIMLLIVNGITNITAAILLFKRKRMGVILGGIFGITLMLWIVIQFIIFPVNFMSTIYFDFGALQALTGIVCYVGMEQSKFFFDESIYSNIETNEKEAVIYFSRTGYTKKLAYELANKSGARLFEIKTTEKIDGNLGFCWCGRFGSNKRLVMPIEKCDIDLQNYSKITVLTPVWVFGIASPIKTFLMSEKDNIKEFDLVCVHFMSNKLSYLKERAQAYANAEVKTYKSISSHFGNYKVIE